MKQVIVMAVLEVPGHDRAHCRHLGSSAVERPARGPLIGCSPTGSAACQEGGLPAGRQWHIASTDDPAGRHSTVKKTKDTPPPFELPKARTGIQGLDEITGGGVPRGRP